MNLWTENILRFVLLLLLQVLLVNNLYFMGVCSPCIFMLFVLLLPSNLPRWADLLIGFAAGLILDIFCNTLGIHTSAMTLVAFLRGMLIKNFVPENERLIGTPSSRTFLMPAFLKYIILLISIYHIVIFSLLTFNIRLWWLTLIQIIVSSLITIGVELAYDKIRRQ